MYIHLSRIGLRRSLFQNFRPLPRIFRYAHHQEMKKLYIWLIHLEQIFIVYCVARVLDIVEYILTIGDQNTHT